MKEVLARLVRGESHPLRARNLAREYLQARTLQELQERGVFTDWAFLGGTALRFLFDLPRFSEDLDFSSLPGRGQDGFGDRVEAARRAIAAEGYDVDAKVNDRKTVRTAFLRFRGLPHELGLPAQPSENLSIRIEVDTNPPAGAGTATTLVRRHVTLHLLHHDKASLLAGKLAALLARPFTKGRDLYDLVWYLSDPSWPEPNLALLGAALRQAGGERAEPGTDDWKERVMARLTGIDWRAAAEDVRPFLERPAEVDLISVENLRRLLLGGSACGG